MIFTQGNIGKRNNFVITVSHKTIQEWLFFKPNVAGVTVIKKKKKHLSCCPYNANYLAETKKFSSRCQYWVYMTSFVQMRGKSGFLRIKFLWSTS